MPFLKVNNFIILFLFLINFAFAKTSACPQTISTYIKKDKEKVSVEDAFKVNKEFCPIEIKEKFANYKITISPHGNSAIKKSYKIYIPYLNHVETYDEKSLKVKSLGISNAPIYRLFKFPMNKKFLEKIDIEIMEIATNKIFKSTVDIR